MADLLQPILKVIPRRTNLPERYDFETLRRSGLDHISRFSGKLWTDHNLHDPGITILEVLCYALIDLGFRTKLPLSDLLARKNPGQGRDDNFFTPAEILTNNPLTILDYRKLLMDLDGVRNAWLVPVKDRLLTTVRFENPTENCGPDEKIFLQGIYKVLIEPEDVLPEIPVECEGDFRCLEDYLKYRVKQTLHAHRNLCEDFEDPKLLCRECLSICADIELTPGADPETVWVEIMRRFRQYVSPDIRYYSLQELLDRGLPIEEIFEGRPMSERSAGFIDTGELSRIHLPKEFHKSDLFKIIAETPGVLSIENLQLKGFFHNNLEHVQTGTSAQWKYKLGKDNFPCADLERSCINFYRNRTLMPGISLTRRLALVEQFLPPAHKAVVPTAAQPLPALLPGDEPVIPYNRFDLPLPQGNFRSDLGEYYSIQQDFPIVYGIGEGHLSLLDMDDNLLDEGQKLRKAQALQLKGYLLFFDQMLANYASQLANLRHLFSMTPDDDPDRLPEYRRTYFAQNLPSVPMVGKLIRFYKDDNSAPATQVDGDPLAIPVLVDRLDNVIAWLESDTEKIFELEVDYCVFEAVADDQPDCHSNTLVYHIRQASFDMSFQRDVFMDAWLHDFRNGTFRIETITDASGAYFVLYSQDNTLAMISRKRYPDAQRAREAADIALILGTLPEAFRPVNSSPTLEFSFDLVYREADYLVFLQRLLEEPETYLQRRNQFLDHLLGRFCEQFSEYAALTYEALVSKEQAQELYKDDKARYLDNYDDLSRNRGRAFDYTKPSWGGANVSGLELKVAALAGMRDFIRQGICVRVNACQEPSFYFELKDYQDNVLFRSPAAFASEKEAATAYRGFLEALRSKDNFVETATVTGDAGFMVKSTGLNVPYAGFFAGKNERKKSMDDLLQLFSGQAGDQTILITGTAFRLNLLDPDKRIVRQGKDASPSAEAAAAGTEAFIQQAAKRAVDFPGAPVKPVWVANPAATDEYFDLKNITPDFPKLPVEYYWQYAENKRSALTWQDQDIAMHGFATAIERNEVADFSFIERRDAAWKLVLRDEKKAELLSGVDFYPDEQRCKLAARLWKTALGAPENLQISRMESGQYRVILSGAAGRTIAVSAELSDETEVAKLRDACASRLTQKNVKIAPEKQAGIYYGFRVADEKSTPPLPLLSSYQLYPGAYEAIRALLRAPEFAGDKDNYVLTGDEGNPDYTYLLRNDADDYAGYLPEVLDDAGERNKRLTAARAYFSKWKAPVEILPEPDRYRFEWRGEAAKSPVLTSSGTFGSKKEAEEAFKLAIGQSVDVRNLRFDPDSRTVLVVDAQENPLAVSGLKTNYPSDLLNAHRQILDTLSAFRYTVATEEFPVQWKFSLGTGIRLENGREIAFLSDAVFDDPEKAKSAFQDFVTKMATAAVQPAKNGNMPLIRIETQDKSSVLFSEPFESAQERDEAIATIGKWMSWSAGIRTAMDDAQETGLRDVYQANNGSEGPECYEIVKVNKPLALHPVPDWKVVKDGECCIFYNHFSAEKFGPNNQQDGLEAMKRLCAQPLPPCLDICLGGKDVTVEEKDEYCVATYRYALRLARDYSACDKKLPAGTVAWQSAAVYETAEDAIKAFEEQYLRILQLAAVRPNYGKDTCIGFETEPDPAAPPADPCKVCTSETRANVEVPAAVWKLFSTDPVMAKKEAALFLSEAARTYPVFPVQNEAEQCGCDCEDSDCPCKGEPGTSDPCLQRETPQPAKYKFHLYRPGCEPVAFDPKRLTLPGELLWESAECYDSPQAARADFDIFITLLGKPGNCRLLENCCSPDNTSIAVAETLIVPVPSGNSEKPNDLKALFKAVKSPVAFHLYFDPAGMPDGSDKSGNTPPVTGCFSFDIVDEDYYVAVHPGSFETRALADAALKNALLKIKDLLADIDCSKAVLIGKDSKGTIPNVHFYKEEQPNGCYKIQLRCKAAGARFEVLLESRETYCPDPCPTDAQQQKIYQSVAVFCKLAKDAANWVITDTDDCGAATYELVDPAKIIGRHPRCYYSATETRAAIERTKECLFKETFYLLEHLLLRPEAPKNTPNENPRVADPCNFPCPDTADCCLEWLPKPEEDCPKDPEPEYYIPFTDPYSFWATVVVPCYTPRFCERNFRQFFEETMRFEAPAHVALCFRWLGPDDICRFETLYRIWLKEISDCKPDSIRIHTATCNLVSFLNKDAIDCPPEDPPAPSPCCDCRDQIPLPVSDDGATANLEAVVVIPGVRKQYQPVCLELFPPQKQPTEDGGPLRQPAPADTTGAMESVKSSPAAAPESKEARTGKAARPPKTTPKPPAETPARPQKQKAETAGRQAGSATAAKKAPVSEKELRLHMSKYTESLSAIKEKKLIDSEGFRYANHFIINNGDSKNLVVFIEKILHDVPKGSKKLSADRTRLLLTGISHSLDKTVLENPDALSDAARQSIAAALDLLSKRGFDAGTLFGFWNAGALFDLTGAASIDTIKSLIIKHLKS